MKKPHENPSSHSHASIVASWTVGSKHVSEKTGVKVEQSVKAHQNAPGL